MTNSSPSGAVVLATYGTLISVAFIMIAARFYLRVEIHQSQRLLMSDMLLGTAWCAAFTTASFDIVFHNKGILKPEMSYTLSNFDGSVEEYEYVAKMVWASVIPFYATLYLCKLSLVAVYFQLFPTFMVKLRIALWVTLGFVISSWIVSMCLQVFLCWPVTGNWQISKPEILCSTTVPSIIFRVGWALHFTGSIAIFVLPFFAIYKLQMRRSMMLGVYAALSLGAVDIAFSLTRFLTVQLTSVDDFRSITIIELWSALDMMIGLIVTCLPSLRPYLRRNFKGSSNSHGNHSNTIRVRQSITVNRKVTTSNVSGHWREHGKFEELVGPDGETSSNSVESHGRVVTIGNSVQVDGGKGWEGGVGGRDSWQEDKRSNHSDIELIHVKPGS